METSWRTFFLLELFVSRYYSRMIKFQKFFLYQKLLLIDLLNFLFYFIYIFLSGFCYCRILHNSENFEELKNTMRYIFLTY